MTQRLEWPRPAGHLWEIEVDASGDTQLIESWPGAEELAAVDAGEIGALVARIMLRGRGYLAVQAFKVGGGPPDRPEVYVSVTAQRRRRQVFVAAFADRAAAEAHAALVIERFSAVLGEGYQAVHEGVPLSRGGSA